ncbi:unnamed protein product [Parascedosporium putredinis]|uniref:CUE domain-containing protein n=1 Tax=Parascedosporium putredinis TaxID=1442378 RepID=A0A9P1H929_9PEZI|nr:unnamed protein product [Parascedosporium putredinis]CAI8001282.1 unnamed protein product [Parascedosporium putredinis]
MVFVVSTSKDDSSELSLHTCRIGYHFREMIVEDARATLDLRPVPHGVASLGVQKRSQKVKKRLMRRPTPLFESYFREFPTRIGKSSNGGPVVGLCPELTLSRRVQLARARKTVESVCLDIIVKWRGDEENGRDQLDTILREVVVISDSEDDDEETGEDSDVPVVISPPAANLVAAHRAARVLERPEAGIAALTISGAGNRTRPTPTSRHVTPKVPTTPNRTKVLRGGLAALMLPNRCSVMTRSFTNPSSRSQQPTEPFYSDIIIRSIEAPAPVSMAPRFIRAIPAHKRAREQSPDDDRPGMYSNPQTYYPLLTKLKNTMSSDLNYHVTRPEYHHSTYADVDPKPALREHLPSRQMYREVQPAHIEFRDPTAASRYSVSSSRHDGEAVNVREVVVGAPRYVNLRGPIAQTPHPAQQPFGANGGPGRPSILHPAAPPRYADASYGPSQGDIRQGPMQPIFVRRIERRSPEPRYGKPPSSAASLYSQVWIDPTVILTTILTNTFTLPPPNTAISPVIEASLASLCRRAPTPNTSLDGPTHITISPSDQRTSLSLIRTDLLQLAISWKGALTGKLAKAQRKHRLRVGGGAGPRGGKDGYLQGHLGGAVGAAGASPTGGATDDVPLLNPRPLTEAQKNELTLKEAFPTVEDGVIKAVLRASRGQVEPAFHALLAKDDEEEGFFETQTKVNSWITNFKKKIDDAFEEEEAERQKQQQQQQQQHLAYGRRPGESSRRSGDYDRYDADPQLITDDFAGMKLAADGTSPPSKSPRPNDGRRVAFREETEEIDAYNSSPKLGARDTATPPGNKQSKWQPLSAVEPSPITDNDPFSLGDSEDEKDLKDKAATTTAGAGAGNGSGSKGAGADDAERLRKAAAEAMADSLVDDKSNTDAGSKS